MNLHLPQTEEARAEAFHLMGVTNNIITPKNGESLIKPIQDFITASYLLSSKDRFFDRGQFTLLCSYFCNADVDIDIPPPTIFKPVELWTGKQVFGVLLRPTKEETNFINLETDSKGYKSNLKEKDPQDTYVVFTNSQLMCGVLDKKVLGVGKNCLYHLLYRDYGSKVCAQKMGALAKLCARFLGNFGFSIGIEDVKIFYFLYTF